MLYLWVSIYEKSGIENISGQSMDDVKVHYTSTIPAQLKPDADSQVKNIHIDPE